MEILTIEIDTPEDKELLLALLPKLNGRLVGSPPVNSTKSSFAEVLRGIHEKGGAGESFGDPSAWQREIRRWDSVLHGREE